MRAYVVLYKNAGFFGKLVSLVLKKYSHTAGFINKTFTELDASDEYPNETDYHTKNYRGIKDFLKRNVDKDRTVAFEIPATFTQAQCNKGINFFKKHQLKNTKYSYWKLLRFVHLSQMDWFLKLHYKIFKKPYVPFGDKNGDDVCSEAFAIAVKKMGWWFDKLDKKWAYLSPETTHPMTWYNVLKDYELKP